MIKFPEKFRLTQGPMGSLAGALGGVFLIGLATNEYLQCIASCGHDWEHVSVVRVTNGQAQAALADAAERKATLVQLLLDKVIDRTIYDAKFAELEAAERSARAVLSRPTDVERVMSAIGDLASAIRDMAPAVQKRNILRLFQRLVVDDDGRFTAARLSGWAHDAFGEVIAYARLGDNDAEGGNQGQHCHLDDAAVWLIELLEAADA